MNNHIAKNFIAHCAKKKGISLVSISRAIHISYASLRNYAKNRRQPDRATALAIARQLDVRVDDLFYIPSDEENT